MNQQNVFQSAIAADALRYITLKKSLGPRRAHETAAPPGERGAGEPEWNPVPLLGRHQRNGHGRNAGMARNPDHRKPVRARPRHLNSGFLR